jgi:glycosyltransferase involved in cell wall biosynthesis
MKRFAIVTGDFVRTGGMDRANFGLADFLARAGAPVHLVAHRVADDLVARPNVTFHRVPKPFNRYALGAPLLGGAGIAHAIAFAAGRDGVLVVNGGNCIAPAVNWVHYCHAAFEPQAAVGPRGAAKLRHRLALATERAALRAARVVLTNSDRTRSDVITHVGVPAERVHTVYYGIDAASFAEVGEDERAEARRTLGWSGDRPRVAFIGALGDRRKGFDVVYDAWRLLCASPSWDADLVVVGTGRELPVWQERAARDGVTTRFSFLGFRRDVPTILAACDALVAPSRYEAYGLGVHEALCRGLPAIVAANAGVAERYPVALAGLLLRDVESADDLARALRAWRDDTAGVRREIGTFSDALRGRSWDDMARDIVAHAERSA